MFDRQESDGDMLCESDACALKGGVPHEMGSWVNRLMPTDARRFSGASSKGGRFGAKILSAGTERVVR